jgi:acetyl-CoA carboxylase carboxyl transferase subunit beta
MQHVTQVFGDPNHGGIVALDDVSFSIESGELIGFLGPRVYETLYGRSFPEGVQVAENLYANGLLDAVLPAEQLADIADRALTVLMAPRDGLPAVSELPKEPLADIQAWESIRRSRRPERPGARQLLKVAASDVVPLNGTGQGERDPGLLLALARFGGAPCVVLGQDRRGQALAGPMGPGALREARRGMRLAAELGLPLLTVIDTPGAALSKTAEEGGMAGEIARCLSELVTLDAPTLCLLLGEGTGGGALALMPADRVVAAQHAWLSPLPPEGASAIMYRTTERAADVAAAQGVRSLDLLRDGIIDRIIAEHDDAADEPDDFCRRTGQVLQFELVRLLEDDPAARRTARHHRYRSLGR